MMDYEEWEINEIKAESQKFNFLISLCNLSGYQGGSKYAPSPLSIEKSLRTANNCLTHNTNRNHLRYESSP